METEEEEEVKEEAEMQKCILINQHEKQYVYTSNNKNIRGNLKPAGAIASLSPVRCTTDGREGGRKVFRPKASL